MNLAICPPATPEASPLANIIPIPEDTPRILIVDDEELIREALSHTLRSEGYEVLTAGGGTRALELARDTQISLILSDQRMPDLSGFELLDRLKAIQPHATRILMTGVLELEMVIAAINQGEIYRFIVKPWLREELLVTIRNGVQRYELICRNAALQANATAMNERLAALNESLVQKVAHEIEQNTQLEKLNHALHQNLERSVEICFKTMQTFYPSLGKQAKRVVELCRGIAEDLQLSPQERQVLEFSGWLHDIGLVGVPRDLIKLWQRAPGSITAAEQAVIAQHPILGQELVSFMDHLASVGSVIRAHHERYDGAGYPDGLVAEAIPWPARLLAVAVRFAESRLPQAEAIETIKAESGRAFDPDAVRTFLRCCPRTQMSRGERPVNLNELEAGMVLAKGIYTANGLLLIPEGQMLTRTSIEKLRNHHRINPISSALLVYC